MAIKTVFKKVKTPIHQIHVGNVKDDDKSGYFGLIMNVNKNGKAIRIANRFNTNRVYILLSEVDNMIEALKSLKADGVATKLKEVTYDTAA